MTLGRGHATAPGRGRVEGPGNIAGAGDAGGRLAGLSCAREVVWGGEGGAGKGRSKWCVLLPSCFQSRLAGDEPISLMLRKRWWARLGLNQ